MLISAKIARAYKAVPITLISVGKGKSTEFSQYAGEWAAKLKRYTGLREQIVKTNPQKASDPHVAREHEAEKVLKLIQPQDWVVVLDERGKSISSEGLAQLVAKAGDEGVANLVFCIGGPFGHGQSVRDRGNHVIKLSNLVLNHQVAQLVLLEALYRSHTILRGEPYHH